MKCPNCDGKGTVLKIIYEDWQKDEIVRSAVKCPRCNGSGEVQTNEEWFCSLSTEEKAKFLACEFTVACDEYAYLHNKETWNENYWVEWLKQPHREE